MKIRDIFVGFPGSVHDARVYRRSTLSRTLHEKCQNLYILGDSAYPLQQYLLTPFKDRGQLTRRQIKYNTTLSKNRIVIEHCFLRLKQKFRQLYHMKLRNMRTMTHLIRACCVLHNWSLDDEVPNLEEGLPAPLYENVEIENEDLLDEVDDRNAIIVRNDVVNIL